MLRTNARTLEYAHLRVLSRVRAFARTIPTCWFERAGVWSCTEWCVPYTRYHPVVCGDERSWNALVPGDMLILTGPHLRFQLLAW